MLADTLSESYVLLTSLGVKLQGFEYIEDMYVNDTEFSNIY